jgi:site-specific DNA recombinase
VQPPQVFSERRVRARPKQGHLQDVQTHSQTPGENYEGNVIIGYVRASTDSVDRISPERQIERIKLYCQLHELGEPTIIRDKKSGYKDKRPGFVEMRALCNKGRVTHVIATDLSRIARKTRTILEFIEDVLTPNKVELVCIDQAIDTTTPVGKAMLAMMAVFAQLYRDEAAHKMKVALKHKRDKGEAGGGHVPFGYDLVDGKLVKNCNEQDIIKFIVALRKEGLSYNMVAKALMDNGTKTKMGGTFWFAKTVYDIVKAQQVRAG